MRFLHCADIHLDSPLRGLERYEGAPVDEVRAAPRRALAQLVDFAVAERVDFVLVAGDLYDGDWQDFGTGLYFTRQMAKLGESGIPVYVLRGNHDAASRITRGLRLPRNVHMLGHARPETILNEDAGVAVHGQSFARADVTEDLAAAYPDAVPGFFNIGMLHTALAGRAGHEPYAPTNLDVLRARGYDYWALGHVHAREIVSTEPWVVFPGNLQGRHIRESGARGAELVEWHEGVLATRPIAFDVMRWAELVLDIAGLADLDALVDRAVRELRQALTAADGRTLATRVRVVGRGRLHKRLTERPDELQAELRAAALSAFGGEAWIEKVVCEVRPDADLARLAQGDHPVGLLLKEFDRLHATPDELEAFGRAVLGDLWAKLPSELMLDEAGHRLETAAVLGGLLAEARDELLARLLEADDA